MISQATMGFLADLSENNYREWFAANKTRYDDAKAEFEAFIFKVTLEILKFDSSISIIDPKKTIFRIYRDVRFSKNKEPYKANFGAHIHAGDVQSAHAVAGYYIHLEPNGKSMLAGGAYMPPGDWIKAIRNEIDVNGEALKEIISNSTFQSYFNVEGDTLQRPPKGFDVSHPHIDLLKYKSLVAVHNLTDEQVLSADFPEHCSKVFKALYPFDQFLNRSMD